MAFRSPLRRARRSAWSASPGPARPFWSAPYRLDKLAQVAAKIDDLELAIVRGRDSIRLIEEKLPSRKDEDSILEQVWRLAENNGLRVQSFRPDVQVSADGLFMMGAKVTELGAGMWHYEYAVQNLNSHRSGGSFSVQLPAGTTLANIGFHDVDYHSGEPWDGTDWTHNSGAGDVLTWATTAFAQDPNANALRWGTLYNFRFDADVEPAVQLVTLGLFRPGVPIDVTAETLAPNLCNTDGNCDLIENECSCPNDCGAAPTVEANCDDTLDDDCDFQIDCSDIDCCADTACALDADSDNRFGCDDCDDANSAAWSTPGEATGVLMEQVGGDTVLTWDAPADLGGTGVTYELLRARGPNQFLVANCLFGADPSLPTASDPFSPLSGDLFAYLVRAVNTCPHPEDDGSIGTTSSGAARLGRTCN